MSLKEEQENSNAASSEKLQNEFHALLRQMNRPSSAQDKMNNGVLLYPDDPRLCNPFRYPVWHGFQAAALDLPLEDFHSLQRGVLSLQQQQQQEQNDGRMQQRLLPEVLNVKLLSPDEMAPDMASPESSARSIVSTPESNVSNHPNGAAIVELPPVPLAKAASKS